jgi:predicted DCC family thiol-disulfide oxidoreductase YuxK
MNNQPIILFDGVCNFCNSAVNFTLKRNSKADIFFAPLQSAAGQKLLVQYHLPVDSLESFVFIEQDKSYKRSTAALKVCKHLRGLWPLCYGFIIVPTFIRDGIYNWIAKNRYKWFGKKETCMIPTPEVKARFLT